MNRKSKAYFDLSALLHSRSELAGVWNSVFFGYGGDIAFVRPYQPGDKIRQIHKPSFARGELMTKEFFGERRMAIQLMTDVARSTQPIHGFEPICAKAAKDSVEMFSDLVQGAADFWGVSMSRYSMPIRGALVFLVSDFYEGPEAYNSLFDHCRNARADVTPVFIYTAWIWHELQRSKAEISGVDVGGAREEGIVSTGEKALLQKEAVFKEREMRLGALLKRHNMPWINLKKPEFSGYVREMTRCFSEKYRTSA